MGRIKRNIPPEIKERQICAIQQYLSSPDHTIANEIYEIAMLLKDVSSTARSYLALWYLLNTATVTEHLNSASFSPFWAPMKDALLEGGIVALALAFDKNAALGSCHKLRTLLEEHAVNANSIPRISENALAGIARLREWRNKRIAHWDSCVPLDFPAIDPAAVLHCLDYYLREIDLVIMGMRQGESCSYAPYSIKEKILNSHNLTGSLKAIGLEHSYELEKRIENDLALLPASVKTKESWQ